MTKGAFLLLIGFAGMLESEAQIPNNGFENWTTLSNYDTPDQWGCLNAHTSNDSLFTCIKGTPGNPGNSYLHLISRTIGSTVIPGIAATGTIDTVTYSVKGGFPYSYRPVYLSGYWQYMPLTTSDHPLIGVLLTKWNSSLSKRDTVSNTLVRPFGMAMPWTPFNITLNYAESMNPDSAQIILSSSGNHPETSSYLNIDSLVFSDVALGIRDHAGISFGAQVFPVPVPASGVFNIRFPCSVEIRGKIELFDLMGNLVMEAAIASNDKGEKIPISVSSLPKGIYLLRITSDMGSNAQKIVFE